MLLHGLSLGLDAAAEEVDALRSRGGGGAAIRDDQVGGDRPADGEDPGEAILLHGGRSRLYSASIVHRERGVTLVAFHASIATSYLEVFDRLGARYATEILADAQVRVGFDVRHPLLPPLVARFLAAVEAEPDKEGAGEVEVNIERRGLG